MWPFSANPSSEQDDGEVKNIVVIGASYAGHTFINDLSRALPASYRIVLIERSTFVLHPPTVVRAVVVPGWEEKNLTAEVTQESIFPGESRHRVLCPNTVKELRRESVIVEHEFEGSTEIPFAKCVIATGSSQPLPMRPKVGSSLEEYKNILRKMQKEIGEAEKFAMIGGGTVGVETIGEINQYYPDKELTLVHSPNGLLHPATGGEEKKTGSHEYAPPPTPPFLSHSLEKQLEKRGVKLILNDKVKFPKEGEAKEGEWDGSTGALGKVYDIPLESGKSFQADYLFQAVGNKPNSQLVEDVDDSALCDGGFIAVDRYFRVQSKKEDSVMDGEYYALGDVANVPGNKTCVSACAEGPALASIIAAEARGAHPTPYLPSEMTKSMVVTLGEGGGAGVIVLPIIGNVSAPNLVLGLKNRDFFAGKSFYSRFKGPIAVAPAAA